jgi:hypothetical protein
MLTEDELNKQVDAMLDDELARRKQALREEIAAKERRKAFNEHMDKINAHDSPIWRAPSPEVQEAYNRQAEESQRAQAEKIARHRERCAAEEAERVKAAKSMPRMQTGGSEGLTIRGAHR